MTHLVALDRFNHYLLSMLIHGVNLQRGQSLMIFGNTQDKALIDHLTELALACRAKTVMRLYYQDYVSMPIQSLVDKAEEGWAFLKLNLFERFVNEDDQAAKMDAFSAYLKPLSAFSQYGKIQSCSSVIPSISWSTHVFPELSEKDAVERMKEELIAAGHCDLNNDLNQVKAHMHRLKASVLRLNKAHLTALTFKSQTCDLTIGLHEDSIWIGGPQLAKGVDYLPNYPTQEVFTANLKHQVNGWFRITRAFRFMDQLIADLIVTIQDGQVKSMESSQDIRAFKDHVFSKDSRRYFGEIALVPRINPIAQRGRLYDCVLLDENAVCHIALGNAYPVSIKDHETKVEDDLINASDLHLDLMIGSEDLVIRAYDGTRWFDLNP